MADETSYGPDSEGDMEAIRRKRKQKELDDQIEAHRLEYMDTQLGKAGPGMKKLFGGLRKAFGGKE